MKIIPVIDLLDDQVVRGVAGEREHYQPITSQLCKSSAPTDVVTAFLQLAPFDTIYIADLNALQNQGNCAAHIESLLNRFPNTQFWVDAGFANVDTLEAYFPHPGFVPIIATETVDSITRYQQIAARLAHRQWVLSLDHKDGRLGLAELFDDPKLWPEQVIVMSLDEVGKNGGPNLGLIADYQALDASTHFIAAGGVRNNEDVRQLDKQGVSAVLVASALHNAQLACNEWYRQ